LTIDPTTGLEQLPEDLFWRIEQDDRNSYKSGINKEYIGLKLALMKKTTKTIPSTTELRVEKVLRDGFWNRFFYGPYVEKTVSVAVPEKHTDTVTELYRRSTFKVYSTKEEEETPREGFDLLSYDNWRERYWYIKAGPVNAEALASLSGKILKEWVTTEHEDALQEDAERYRDSFVGDYPPKTLVGAGV
jgi:hypothetical protein